MSASAQAPSNTLGNEAKSIHAARKPKPGAASAESRRIRYDRMRTVGRLLFDRNAEHVHRTCKCHRFLFSEEAGVGVFQTREVEGARLSGVNTCGSVWACPVCAPKIASRRQVELEAGQVRAHAQGLHGYLLTLTFPHEHGMPLVEITGAFAVAMQRFKNSRAYKGFMERHQRLGSVKGLEVTWGHNGWHPHVHELVWAAPGLLEDTRGLDRLKAAWVNCLLKAGLGSPAQQSDMMAHGLDFRGGDDAAAYIAKYGRDEKWGVSHEVLPGPSAKAGQAGHMTPWQLLARAADGDGQAAALFREYAQAFEGKRALTWTPGLKDALGIKDLSDEELAELGETPAPEEHQVGRLTTDQYQAVLARDLVADLLYIVATWPGMGQDDLDDLVDGWIASTPRRSSGQVWVRQRGVGAVPIMPAGHFHAA